MAFVDTIFSLVWDIADAFYEAAYTASNWWTPFSLLQYPLYAIFNLCLSLLNPLAHFSNWVNDVAAKIADLLTWSTIYSLILQYFPGLQSLITWFQNVTGNIISVVNQWWNSWAYVVQGWISAAVQGFQTFLDNITAWVGDLDEAWDDFWTRTWPLWTAKIDSVTVYVGDFIDNVLPTLVDILSVQNLVESTLRSWFPFYNILSAIIDIAGEFFGSPLDWLLDHFEDWFWGEEE